MCYSDTVGLITLETGSGNAQLGARFPVAAASLVREDFLDQVSSYVCGDGEDLDYTSDFAATIKYDLIVVYGMQDA